MESWRISNAPFHGDFFQDSKSFLNLEETRKRGQFFMTAENLYEDEYLDDLLPEKKRRLSPEQVQLLENSFEEENKLEPERKSDLAKKLGLPPRQVAVWFQNRRARWKTKQLEKDYDQLKSSYESLLSNYDSLLRDNLKLKSQLMSLTEDLEAKEATGEVVSNKPTEQLPAEVPPFIHVTAWGEDWQSTGSVDDGRNLIDSGESYFPDGDYPDCVAAVYYGNSEEDEGSDGSGSDLSNVFGTTEQVEPLMWSTWS